MGQSLQRSSSEKLDLSKSQEIVMRESWSKKSDAEIFLAHGFGRWVLFNIKKMSIFYKIVLSIPYK